MKIGNTLDHPALAAASAAAPVANATAVVAATAAGPSAKVELSSAASLMSAGSGAEFDVEKVARISQSIGDGTFKINPGAIADKLIANAQELLSKGSR